MRATLLSISLFSLMAFIAQRSAAQEYDPAEAWKGMSYGFNIGYYHANSYNANFYNGSPDNDNSLSFVLSNPYWREEINQYLGVTDTFLLTGYPEKMGYNPALSLGFSMRYSTNGRSFGFIRFNYARLTASDYITLEVDPNSFLTFPDIRLIDIYGVENRMFLDIGYTRYQMISEQVDWFMQVGANMTNIDVVGHKLRFGSKEYSLVNIYGGQQYVPGLPLQEYVVDQGGIGFGIFGGAGLRLNAGPGTSLEPGIDVYVKRVNLPGYQAYRPHFNFYVRLGMKTGERDEN